MLRIEPLCAHTGFDHDTDRIHPGPGRRYFSVATWDGHVHVIDGDGQLAGLDLEPLLSLQEE